MDTGLVDSGQRELGESFVVGPLALGCWRFDEQDVDAARSLVEAALALGILMLDTADVYGVGRGGVGEAERRLGEVFRRVPGLRDRFVVATKAGIVPGVPYDSSAPWLRAACEASLRRMGIEVIDLFQIHRPDPFTHPGEVADALVVLHEEGKIREIGVSNHTPAQVNALQAHLPLEIASIQPELSPAHVAPIFDGTLDQALELGLTTFAWSPLANGRIVTGEGVRPELVAVLDALAEREGVSRAAVSVAFVLAHPVSPVALLGTSRPKRLAELSRAREVHLSRADVYSIIEASTGRPLP